MKKIITILLGLLSLLFAGCSNETISNHLVFQGENEHWKGVVEVNQSNNGQRKYDVKERHHITYIGDNLKELETKKIPVKIYVDSVLSNGDQPMSSSHFQEWYGTEEGGITIGFSDNKEYAKKDDEFKVVIEWMGTEEIITLKSIQTEHD
ncbi:hypothetical protein [Gracilibacillus sp. YIM 98692]|uniref:hypothetical protein n=1 Tax=Gracilibacillus sp. YIM 98692 TaxID=2663532 RepID=UPI0013CFFC9B|nr:hypothetical protein [Gracilibacillus sp. YIM 98692]